MLRALALVVVAGCHFSALGSTTIGAVSSSHESGWAIQSAVGVGEGATGMGMHLGFRRATRSQELALGLHGYVLSPSRGINGGMFVRAGVNLLEWDRVGSDDGLGVLGPSFEIGAAASNGLCIVASANHDVRFNDPDETFVGLSFGMCAVMSH